ncbi:MAG: DUF4173 domain-containing protein [Lachnoclostridium sp.]|nr:DUF4173 domain-containing protein [Lachnospira sp.]MCM1249001.1 DUF4173 domain-containing protein [Lachnoclostridium sp.]
MNEAVRNEVKVSGNSTWDQPSQLQAVPNPSPVPVKAQKEDTEATGRMKRNFPFFGGVTLVYAIFYAFCMFRNGSGVTFPFFMAGSLLYLCFSLSKLEISLKKGSWFYMISVMLLAVSTFCTDDGRIIFFNKLGIFLLMISLMLQQFFDTSQWKFGKYMGAILELIFAGMGELGRPFSDASVYMAQKEKKKDSKFWYMVLGVIIALPLLLVVWLLLNSADAVFRDMSSRLFGHINLQTIFSIAFRICFLYLATYLLTAYLCKHEIKEEVKDKRNGEPVLAITVTGMLSALYLVFSVIQIAGLFLGKMQLPEGYTYASYAREGFFQLLAVSILNLIIVLVAMSFFKESRLLKAVLTVMSFCTFIMIASSALRMIIYIKYYYMTFLRILVLWGLGLLFFLFLGVVANIFAEKFPLFCYSMVVVTVLYLALSFSHPDYIIAKINVANAPKGESTKITRTEDDFFQSSTLYHDYTYLSRLNADAAPVLIPYLRELGYDMAILDEEDISNDIIIRMDREGEGSRASLKRSEQSDFGYYYLQQLQKLQKSFSWRTFNVSRYMALRQLENN